MSSAADRVRYLSNLLLAGRAGVVVAVEVYMDESGVHDDAQIVTASAVWATPEVWAEWTIDWQKRKWPVTVFHAVDCHGRKGEFCGWDRDFRDQFVIDLLPAIPNHKIEGRIAALDKRAMARLLSDRPDVAAWVGDPYLICFQWALEGARRVLEERGETQIAIIQETNDYAGRIAEIHKSSEKRFKSQATTFSQGTKREYIPLQCADVLAYEGYKQFLDAQEGLRKPLAVLDPDGTRMAFLKRERHELKDAVQTLIDAFDGRLRA